MKASFVASPSSVFHRLSKNFTTAERSASQEHRGRRGEKPALDSPETRGGGDDSG